MRTNAIDLLQGCFDENWRKMPKRQETRSNDRQSRNEENQEPVFRVDRQYDLFWEVFG